MLIQKQNLFLVCLPHLHYMHWLFFPTNLCFDFHFPLGLNIWTLSSSLFCSFWKCLFFCLNSVVNHIGEDISGTAWKYDHSLFLIQKQEIIWRITHSFKWHYQVTDAFNMLAKLEITFIIFGKHYSHILKCKLQLMFDLNLLVMLVFFSLPISWNYHDVSSLFTTAAYFGPLLFLLISDFLRLEYIASSCRAILLHLDFEVL